MNHSIILFLIMSVKIALGFQFFHRWSYYSNLKQVPISTTIPLQSTISVNQFLELISPNATLNQKLTLFEIIKDFEIEKKATATMNLLELAKKDFEIASLERQLLYSNQACTSRGIFEHALKGCQVELQLKGAFNARTVCAAVNEYAKNNIDLSRSAPRWTRFLIIAAAECNMDTDTLYDLWHSIERDSRPTLVRPECQYTQWLVVGSTELLHQVTRRRIRLID